MATKNVPEVWSDLHHDIIVDAKGSIKKVINIDSVLTSIDNIIGTFQGERVMLPEFASNLKDLLFEPMTEELMDFIGYEVRRVIERWDNRVVVLGVNFFADHDRNNVDIQISFNIRGYTQIFYYSKNYVIGGQNV